MCDVCVLSLVFPCLRRPPTRAIDTCITACEWPWMKVRLMVREEEDERVNECSQLGTKPPLARPWSLFVIQSRDQTWWKAMRHLNSLSLPCSCLLSFSVETTGSFFTWPPFTCSQHQEKMTARRVVKFFIQQQVQDAYKCARQKSFFPLVY